MQSVLLLYYLVPSVLIDAAVISYVLLFLTQPVHCHEQEEPGFCRMPSISRHSSARILYYIWHNSAIAFLRHF